MTAILHRLQTSGVELPLFCVGETNRWIFAQELEKQNINFFRQLAQNHHVLNFEYHVHCTQLARELTHGVEVAELIPQLKAALIMSELLTHTYGRFLNMPHDVLRLRREQETYRQFLSAHGYHFPSHEDNKGEELIGESITHDVRMLTVTINWPRLFITRSRRLLLALSVLAQDFSQYRAFIVSMDKFAGPVIAYVSWMFFVPRLLTNLALTAKHVIPGRWMSTEEWELGWRTRLKLQWESRWFEISNDSAWLITGLLNCFVLTGPLNPLSIYLAISLQSYDVVMACLRMNMEVSRLQKIKADYDNLLSNPDLSQEQVTYIEAHAEYLQHAIECERRRLLIGIVNTSVLFLAMSLALPAAAAYPILPVFGAMLAVSATIASYKGLQWADKQRFSSRLPKPESQLETPPATIVPARVSEVYQCLFSPRLSNTGARSQSCPSRMHSLGNENNVSQLSGIAPEFR